MSLRYVLPLVCSALFVMGACAEQVAPSHSGAGGVAGGAGSGGSGAGGTAAAAGTGGPGATAGSTGLDGGGGAGGVAGATGAGGAAGAPGAGGAVGGGGGAVGGRTGRGGAAGTATAGAAGTAGVAGAAGATGAAGSTGAAGGAGSSGATIVNDRFWKDTSGNNIYSQGGGVLRVADTYYWYGVKYGGAPTYAANPTNKNSDTSFQGVTTYSSRDLVSWKLEAVDMPANTSGWFGRLGVAYNANTKKYVLVAQGGGGLYFATSDKPNGGFVYDNVQTNLPGIVNGATGDQTIFQDDDGQAYLVSSSSNGRANRYVSPLRASDFLAAENAVLVYKGSGREGNCMFKYNGTYTFCSSDLHGWNASQTYCVSATNIKGPYGAEFVLAGTERDFSHVTQTGFFISVKGTEQTTIIFAGDRWSDFAANGLGFNQWMPLTFTGATPAFQSLSQWTIDAATGSWHVAPGNNWILNPTFEADRVAVTTPAGWTANGTNSNDGHTGNWSWQLAGTATLSQTVSSLPNGTYTLSVWTKSSAAGAMLSVTNTGAGDKTVAIPSSTAWTNVTLTSISVTAGHADIGVAASGQAVKVDDFTLIGG
jgi:hypothetical protein